MLCPECHLCRGHGESQGEKGPRCPRQRQKLRVPLSPEPEALAAVLPEVTEGAGVVAAGRGWGNWANRLQDLWGKLCRKPCWVTRNLVACSGDRGDEVCRESRVRRTRLKVPGVQTPWL